MQVEQRVEDRLRAALSAGLANGWSEEEIGALLREEGIDSYDDLLAAVMESLRGATRKRPQAVTTTIDVLRRPTQPHVAEQITHGVPSVPVLLDGAEIDPSELQRFNGRPLDYILTSGGGREVLGVFTDRELVTRWLEMVYLSQLVGYRWPARRSRVDTAVAQGLTLTTAPSGGDTSGGGGVTPAVVDLGGTATGGPYYDDGTRRGTAYDHGSTYAPPVPPGITEGAMLYDNTLWNESWGGSKRNIDPHSLYVPLHTGFQNLDDDWRAWPGSTWNDCTSSLGLSSNLAMYWSDADFSGNRLVIPAGHAVGDLATLGWNNTISSVASLGPGDEAPGYDPPTSGAVSP